MSVDWAQRYEIGDTPWEKGEHHPGLPSLLSIHHELIAAAKKILVPGCGFGHDADCLGEIAGGEIVGLDVAQKPIEEAEDRDRRDRTSWRVGDLFQWEGQYDLVFEHTCFCAIPLDRRSDYVAAMDRLIPEGGHLLGFFFLNPDHEGEEGPPFGVTKEELNFFFQKNFELLWEEPPEKTFPSRIGEGRELSMLWQKRTRG